MGRKSEATNVFGSSKAPLLSTTLIPLSCHGLWLAVSITPALPQIDRSTAADTAAVGTMPKRCTFEPPANKPRMMYRSSRSPLSRVSRPNSTVPRLVHAA